MFKYNFVKTREYIFIILTATIFLFKSTSDLNSKENLFVVKDVQIEDSFDVNFSRDKLIDKALKKSFAKLLSNILIQDDIKKLKKTKLSQIKKLVFNFKISDEKFLNNKYIGTFHVTYDDFKIKEFLRKKNISFFAPKSTTVVFFPILFIKNEIKIFNENFLHTNWLKSNSSDLPIKYLLPLENLDDMLSIYKTKDEIENINFKKLAQEYNTNNFAIAIMDYEENTMKIYLKTNLDNKQYTENLSYKMNNLNNKLQTNHIIDDLKVKIMDMWKKANLINIPLPLNIFVRFQYKNPKDLNNLENTLKKIHVINTFTLVKFDINNSFYKINYYGNPKKLSDEFHRFKYNLKDDKGYWELEIDD